MSTIEKARVTDHMPHEQAMAIAHCIAETLRKHGATKVILFGSLRTPRYDPYYSDIDIYYEGIPLADTLHAEADATWETGEEDETGRCRVDIINEHTRDAKLKKTILSTGCPL
jgi:predicted nucleotidyltransferase